jgi:tetratricopeptide (TPR) repeat protein
MESMKMDFRRIALLCMMVLAFATVGCNQTGQVERNAIAAFHHGEFAKATEMLRGPAARKDENYVLNNYRLGSAALAAGDIETAQSAFYTAYEIINSGDTNDAGRALSASVVFEGIKVFKGEPFERAMAHYYLGMIFLIRQDYQNARAAFQNSNFQVRQYAKKDSVEEFTAVQSKFALGYFGLGFANLRLGRQDLARDNFQLAVNADPQLQGLVEAVQQPGVNTLIFVDRGHGPVKAARGWYNEESAFGPTPAEAGPIGPVTALVDGRAITGNINYNTVDTLALAQERTWQDIDTLRKVKAVVGTGLMAAGTGMAAYGASNDDEGMVWAGLGTAVLGALMAASSQSDVRYWEMLPRNVYVIPASLPPGPHEIYVQGTGPKGGTSRSGTLTTNVTPGGDNIFYFRLP